VGLPNGLRKFTVVLAPVAMMVCGFDLGAAPTSSNGLVMTLVPTQKSFVAGELEYVRFVIENKGTNASEVDLGRCMVGNIPMWTESDPTKKLNRLRIPINSDSCSNNNRTRVPMLFGQ
jgi:hypothetical protein